MLKVKPIKIKRGRRIKNDYLTSGMARETSTTKKASS